MNIIKIILEALRKDTSNKLPIAKHLARVALYELKKEDSLHPAVKAKFEVLKKKMKGKGKPIWLVEGFRSAKRQDSLSSSVTAAKGLQSYHQYGVAFDVAFVGHNWAPPAGWWKALGEEGKKLGLIWGGDWKSRDFGHFEYHPGFTWKNLKPYFEEE